MKSPNTKLMWFGVGILGLQLCGQLLFQREDSLQLAPPLTQFPSSIGGWKQAADEIIDAAVVENLGSDDLLSRRYQSVDGTRHADLFIAYYKSQAGSLKVHDPKICLPGGGWSPLESRTVEVSTTEGPVEANYYHIEKGLDQELVLYWLQTHKGTYANGQKIQADRLVNALRDKRSDVALVRIVVPIREAGVESASNDASTLAQLVYPEVLRYIPREAPSSP